MYKQKLILLLILVAGHIYAQTIVTHKEKMTNKLEIATLGNGCFWCTETLFERLEGVENVSAGYTGGKIKNPTYKEICTGTTGHAEVIQIEFNPTIITFQEILEVFFSTHDPTTLNRQGGDIGTQYRSAIFYHSLAQKEIAIRFIQQLESEKVFAKPITTEVTALDVFYMAENYHQNYYNNNKTQGYCVAVINPKLEKFLKKYKNKLKKVD